MANCTGSTSGLRALNVLNRCSIIIVCRGLEKKTPDRDLRLLRWRVRSRPTIQFIPLDRSAPNGGGTLCARSAPRLPPPWRRRHATAAAAATASARELPPQRVEAGPVLLAPPTSPPPARPVLDTARRQCLLCSPSCWLVDPATLTAWVSFATAQAGTPAAARRLVAAFWPYVPAAARQPLPPAAGDPAGAASSPSFPAATRPSRLPPPLFPLRTPCFLSFASSTPLLVPAVPSRRRSFWR